MSANKAMLQISAATDVEAAPAIGAQNSRWRLGAVAGAIALIGSLVSLPVHALSLGRITVQSSLGEPLRAEIDISDISPQEASTLNARLGSADAFKAAGLEFSQVLNGVEINLQRRPDGRSFLRLRGSRPVAEPFLDLLIQTNTANGSLSRDYAVLLDPPSSKSTADAAASASPAITRPAAPTPSPAPSPAARTTEPPRPATASTGSAPVARVEPSARPAPAAASGDRQVTVKPGETAGKLAAQNKPEGVSLDQMLLAMQRGNPNAFIGGNVNRIKAGAVVNLPGAEAASVASPAEASQSILAQSKDFNAFRRNFAESVPSAQVAGADRAAGGSLTARVEDRAAASAAPDKLTLSKGAVQSRPGVTSEDTIARNRQASDASARVAELSKNISDLNKLGAGTGTSAGVGTATAPAPGVTLPVPSGGLTPVKPPVALSNAPAVAASAAAAATPVPTPTTVVGAPAAATPPTAASAAASTPAAAVAGSTAVNGQPASADASGAVTTAPAALSSSAAAAASASTGAAKPAAAPAPARADSFVMSLLDNPLILPLGAGLLALLAGFGIYRYRRQHQNVSVDSSFLESRLQPDSFFGASGGQRIDTSEAGGTGSSLVYSPSQLDAAGDVDPVAEADVYLAYGRDLQAEEILKEALRTTPGRAAIYAKLCEIYAKRRDVNSFNAIATKAHALTKGTGAEWGLIGGMGHELDATNSLYKDSAQASRPTLAPQTATPLAAARTASATITVPPASAPLDIDFDLDLGSASDPATGGLTMPSSLGAASSFTTPSPLTVTPPSDLHGYVVLPDLDLDFSSAPAKVSSGTAPSLAPHTSFVNTYTTGPAASTGNPSSPATTAAGSLNSGMLEFDLDSLSLDLGTHSVQDEAAGDSRAVAGSSPSDSPLETKFSLAEEFRSLGDAEGARSLAQEVVAEAQGPLKAKAQAFINALV